VKPLELAKQATLLTSQHPWVKFPFGTKVGTNEWAFRYLVGCISVGGTNEAAVLSMAPVMFDIFPSISVMAGADPTMVAKIMSSHGVQYSPPKAKNIVRAAGIIMGTHKGKVPSTRAELEALPGVGRHVASVILATVFGQNEFAVDLHVRRIMERWGYVGTDLALEQVVREQVPAEQWGHFSRAFVDFGQSRCGAVPNCNGCPVEGCGSAKVIKVTAPKTTKVGTLAGYDITATAAGWVFQAPGSDKTCTVKPNKTCSCNGFRFKRNCKHVNHVFATP